MRADLALHALERVVDGLAVAVEVLADARVGMPVEVEREHAGLEVGEHGREARHQRAELFGGDHLVDRVPRGRAWEDLVEGRLGLTSAGGGGREGDVAVERRVLVARRRLHRGDDLPRDAQLREVAKGRLTVRPEVADRLVEPDEALLDEVVGVAPDQEVRRRLEAYERVVAAHEPVIGGGVALLRHRDEEAVINMTLTLRSLGDTSHEHTPLRASRGPNCRGALLPWRL